MKGRSDGTRIGIVDENGAEVIITFSEFCRRLDVDGWVRLHTADFAEMMALEEECVHFNLEWTSNLAGKRYGVVPILRPGKRHPDGTEQLPVVDLKRCRVALCLEVLHRVPIESVTAEHYKHSLASIPSADALRRALVSRYSAMFPQSSPEELLARGCSITRLRFLSA